MRIAHLLFYFKMTTFCVNLFLGGWAMVFTFVSSLYQPWESFIHSTTIYGDFPGGSVGKTLRSQCTGPWFDPWLGNYIPHAATKSLHVTTKTRHSQNTYIHTKKPNQTKKTTIYVIFLHSVLHAWHRDTEISPTCKEIILTQCVGSRYALYIGSLKRDCP